MRVRRRAEAAFRSAAVLGIALIVGLAGLAEAASPSARPPNVVLILGDDHGWPYSGFMGHPVVRTPNLDELARQGTLFSNGHVTASTCTPSHRSLLSGLHPLRWAGKKAALEAQLGPLPRRSEVEYVRTLPRELARAGYRSWQGGKLWEGTFALAGFSAGLTTRILGPLQIDGGDFGRVGWEGASCGPTGAVDQACPALEPVRGFLDQASDAPFFLWFAPALPHSPFDAPQELRDLYSEDGIAGIQLRYFANLSWLDALVGELLAELDARGLGDDTLVVYLSDNGWTFGDIFGAGFSRAKASLNELGFRSPILLRWPGHVPEGVVRDDLVSSLDLFPTILDYAGLDPPSDRRGRSLREALESGAPFGRESVVGFYQLAGRPRNTGYFVRTKRWRYIAFQDGSEELYEIERDPFEEHDVAALHPAVVEAQRTRIAAWLDDLGSTPPGWQVAGRLANAAGTGRSGAALRLRGRAADGRAIGLSTLTGPDGRFRFDALPAGLYRVRAHGVGPLAMGQGARPLAPLSLPLDSTGAWLPLVGPGVGSDLPEGGASVVGRLSTTQGAPLAGAKLFVHGRPGGGAVRIELLTDERGRYRAHHLPEGAYRVLARPTEAHHGASRRIVLESGESRELDLVVAPR